MSWFYESWSLSSSKNGTIHVKRFFGDWDIIVDGCSESSAYMRDLWKNSLKHLPKEKKIKRILMLGLAAGSSINTLHQRYPGCHITAIEWDPVMITLLDKMSLFPKKFRPEILVGDAAELVASLNQAYDLVLYDLYHGSDSPAQVKSSLFFQNLANLLEKDGFLIVNAYRQNDLQLAVKQVFSLQSSWNYYHNQITLYKHFGRGTLGEALPEGYQPFRCSKNYLQYLVEHDSNQSIIGEYPALGIRRTLGPFTIDRYFGDDEPLLSTKGPMRLEIWQRVQLMHPKQRWRESYSRLSALMTGFVDLSIQTPLDAWSAHAKRQLKRWLAQSDQWRVVPLSTGEYIRACYDTKDKRVMEYMRESTIRNLSKSYGSALHCVGIRSVTDDTASVRAGFVSLDIPELSQSVHITSFVDRDGKNEPFSIGLVYHWFIESQKKGIRFLDFDLFYSPGNPESWMGFSRFKSQFGTRYLRYPKTLFRFVLK